MARLVSILIVLASIQAQPASAQWMIGAYIGWAAPFKTNVRVDSSANATDVLFDDVRFQTKSFESPLYYGIRAGRTLGTRFGAELEMTHLKVFAEVDTPVMASGSIRGTAPNGVITPRSIMDQLNVSHGMNMVLANFVTRFPLGSPAGGGTRAVLITRFGIGPTVSHTEGNVLGMTAEHYESGGLAMQGAAGMEFPIWKGVYLLGEYKYTASWQHLSVGSAAVEMSPATHHLVSGITYHFP
jgi:Outer membrane protein beta-barrel domain